MRSGLAAERRRRSAEVSSPTAFTRFQRVRFGPVAWSWTVPRRNQCVFVSLGDTAGSPCHAGDAPGRLLGLPESEPHLELYLQDYTVLFKALQELISMQDEKIRLIQTSMNKVLKKLNKS
jgi:hypothetical protein